MLLSQEVCQGVEVLSVRGPVQGRDAAVLQQAVSRAVDLGPRGVLIDLADACDLSPAAVDVLNWASASAAGWPRPALAVCCAPAELGDLLLPEVSLHDGREQAMAHMDDRPEEQDRVRATVSAGPSGPGEARRIAEGCAREHGFDGDDLALVVTELVTNAVRHGAPPIELEIDACEHCVTVVVVDSGSGRPLPRDAQDDDEGGRGLQLVEVLAAETGVRAQPPGKAVWAELPLP